MKKILVVLISLLFVVGCACSNDKASDAVEKYLNNYKSLSDNVLEDIDELVENENLADEQSETYKEVLKRQYRDLVYTIENESYDGDTADVTVKITVYDYYKASKDANNHLNNNQEEFLTDGEYDATKYLNYKLNQMKIIQDSISYNIVFRVINIDNKWQVEQPDEDTLEKLHGIYNYEKK